MNDALLNLSSETESKLLALEYMRQKSLVDDAPADIAREYKMVQQQIKAALESM